MVEKLLHAPEDAEALTEVPEGLRELLAQLLLPTPELDCVTSVYVTEVHPDGWAHVNVDQEGCSYHWGIFADYGDEWFEVVSSDDGDYLCDELIALGVPRGSHTVECSG